MIGMTALMEVKRVSKTDYGKAGKPVAVRVPTETRKQLEEAAKREHRTLSAQALMYIEQGLSRSARPHRQPQPQQ